MLQGKLWTRQPDDLRLRTAGRGSHLAARAAPDGSTGPIGPRVRRRRGPRDRQLFDVAEDPEMVGDLLVGNLARAIHGSARPAGLPGAEERLEGLPEPGFPGREVPLLEGIGGQVEQVAITVVDGHAFEVAPP